MNYKQKLGYMALGAGILALGITIGQIITPDIEAQNNGVFDKIVCRDIEVVDRDGNKAIVLSSHAGVNRIILYNQDGEVGKEAIALTADGNRRVLSRRDTGIRVYDKDGTLAIALSTWESLSSGEPINEVSVHGKDESGVGLYSNYGLGSRVYVQNEHRTGSVFLDADETGGYVNVYDKYNNPAIRLDAGELSNEVIIYNKHAKEVSSGNPLPNIKKAIRLFAILGGAINQINVYDEHEKNAIDLTAGRGKNLIAVYNKRERTKWMSP